MTRGNLLAWGPAIAWATAIASVSSIPSAHVPAPSVVGIDKVAHFVEYAIFGFLLARAFALRSGESGRSLRVVFLLGALVATVFGALDETHQLWIPGRSASVLDFVADAAGAHAGAAALAWWRRGRRAA